MVDRIHADRKPEGGARTTEERPHFLQVFDELRRRPPRSRARALRRMGDRAARHRLLPERGPLQRGDLAEPPPVLDLVLDEAGDRTRVEGMLVEACAVGPVWTLSSKTPPVETEPIDEETEGSTEESAPAPRRATKRIALRRGRRRLPGARPEPDEIVRTTPTPPSEIKEHADAAVTTGELYELIGRLVDGGFSWEERGDQKVLVPPRRRRPPPHPRLPRLRSLLWLHRCGRGRDEEDESGEGAGGRLGNDGRSQIEVIDRLREARLEVAVKQRDKALEEPASTRGRRWTILYERALVHWRRVACKVTRFSHGITQVSEKATFGLLDEKLLTPLSFVVSIVLAAAPFAFVGLVAQQVDEIVSLVSALVLAVAYLLTVFFFFLPWRPYLWLDHYRWMLRDHGERTDDKASSGRFRRPRALGVHLYNELHHPRRDRGRVGGEDQAKGTRPPASHRIAVNALLDDLHRLYGASRRGSRSRKVRPVLIYDQRDLAPVDRYLVRLIEDERLRRALPDPLLLVQIRDGGQAPLVPGGIESGRYGRLPERDDSGKGTKEVRGWLRRRHLAGVLGVSRTLTLKVAPLPREIRDRRWYGTPEWFLTRPARAGLVLGGGAVASALLVLLGLVLVPAQVQALRPCVQEGVTEPRGITRIGGECVGVTFGDFVFHDRLSEVTELIREQNEAVDRSGDPYVTVAHIAELSVSGSKNPSLAGVQGELLGMAYQQREHNLYRRSGQPGIKLLLGNAGEDWAHAMVTAEEIVRRARNEGLGMDRPIAAVGFGQSVVPNSAAVQKVAEASIPMVGTTATYDDVARYGVREHSEFYFPVAASNSRIAEQTAHWARVGVPWTAPDGTERGLPAHGTAVAIANAETDTDGGEHEQYGPHLARGFMEAFVERGGEIWEGVRELDSEEYDDSGVLLYRDGDQEGESTYAEYLGSLCDDAENDPPDLLYYAGRSDDFTEFYRRFRRTGGADCTEGRMTILGGDDISKFVSDAEVLIERNSEYHPVFYTPLAPSGPWGVEGGSDQGFYEDIDELVTDLYAKGEEETLPAKDELPSIAHAAVGGDALLVLADALPPAGPTKKESRARELLRRVGLGRPAFLRTDELYEEKRDELYGAVKDTRNLTGVSGHIEFDTDNDGNWFDGRMVQLVLAGPRLRNEETDRVQRQHVVQRCGRRNANTIETGEQCLPVDAPRER